MDKAILIRNKLSKNPILYKDYINNWFKRNSESIAKKHSEEEAFRLFYGYNYIFWKNIEIINKYSESEIEKVFLNSLCLMFPYKFIFLNPLANIEEDIKKLTYLLNNGLNFKTIGYPHEKKFAQSVAAFFNSKYIPYKDFNFTDDIGFYLNFFHNHYYQSSFIFIQSTFHTDKQIFRPDIFIWHPKTKFKLIVECDGYSYHKDKTVFEKDRQRDRVFISKGYKTMRFSGLEIYQNPVKAAKELVDFLVQYNLSKMWIVRNNRMYLK